MLKRALSILYPFIILLMMASCHTSTPEEPVDLRLLRCQTIGLRLSDEIDYRVYPFPVDSGYVCVVPQVYKDTYTFEQEENGLTPDSLDIRYSQLGSIFINTQSGSMKDIHASKNHSYREAGIIKIVNERGEVEYDDSLKFIKGRGNTSWTVEKRSYNIQLSSKCSPLGLKKSKKFNIIDTHGITNVLGLQIARDFGASSAIESCLVNLYLNGEYRGLFLITNKVDISKASVDITNLEKQNKKTGGKKQTIESEDGMYKYVDGLKSPKDITGGYLIEVMNFQYKYKYLPCGFVSQEDNHIRFKSPENATREEVLYISGLYKEFYDAIKAPDGVNPMTGRYYADYIDLESFARYYLVEETLSNMDAGYGNLYFYKDCDSIDPKIYAGPVWDVEWSMGINDYPYFNYPEALNLQAGSNNESQKLFYYLFQHEDFRQLVCDLYQNELYPMIDSIISSDPLPSSLKNDGRLNYCRWPDRYTSSEEEFGQLCSYMRPHIEFLKEIFSSDDRDYCCVSVNAGYSKRNIMFMVQRGTEFTLPDLPWFSTDGVTKEKEGWYENDTPLDNDTQFIDADKYYELRWKSDEK